MSEDCPNLFWSHVMFRLPLGSLAALLLLAIPAALPVRATSRQAGPVRNGPVSVTATKHHMRLVLRLRRTAYPANALVPVTLHLTNLSRKTVYLYDCLGASLGAEVMRGRELELYPELLAAPGAPWPNCPGEPAMGGMPRHRIPIQAGKTLTRMTYVVLRAFSVRAWADLAFTTRQLRAVMILTPLIHLRRVAGSGPAVRIDAAHPTMARVTPVRRAGPVEYSEWVSCAKTSRSYPTDVLASATFSRWTRAKGVTLAAVSPPCSQFNEWMLFVAQPGLPIAQAYYCRRHDLCAYAPPTRRENALSACKLDIAKAVESGKLPHSVVDYAVGLSPHAPSGLTPAQRSLARRFNKRCAPLMKLKP